jgi:TatD DNase family protein
MESARSANLPIIIHCRPSDGSENAWNDCFRLLQEYWAPHGLRGVMHCFTGTPAHAQLALDLGFLISFAGNITFPKAQQIRESALQVPLDRMLIETDCPFLAPVPNRGKRNEPAFVRETARKLAELRGVSLEELGLQTAKNFYRFFSLHEKAHTI